MFTNRPASNRLALVIEDNPMVAEIFAYAIQEMGYNVEIIDDGAKAVTRLETLTPDLIILDINLPHVSGLKIYEELRSQERTRKIQVIVTTGNIIAAERLEETNDLYMVCLVKPVKLAKLAEIIRSNDQQESA